MPLRSKFIDVKKPDVLTGHTGSIFTLASGSQPYIVYSSGGDGAVVEWDLRQTQKGKVVAKVPASVYALHYDLANKQLYIGQNNEGIHVIDPQSLTVIKSLKITDGSIFGITTTTDKIWIATAKGELIVLNKKYEQIANISLSEKSLRCLAVSPDGTQIACGYSDHFIRIFDTQNLKLLYSFQAHENSVFGLAYSPALYGRLLSVGRDATIKSWQVQQNYELEKAIPAHLYTIHDVCFSPNNRLFATCSIDKSVKIWDTATLRLLKVIDKGRHAGHGTAVNKLLWTTYHDWLLSASDDQTISAWQLTVLEPLLKRWEVL